MAPPEPRATDSDATDDTRVKRPSAEDIEARKERLKKLREEREARRRQLLDNPVARPNLRDRFQKPALPLDRDSAPPSGEIGEQ